MEAVSALGFQIIRVHVYLAQLLQPGQSRVCSSAATVDQGVVNMLRLPDVHVDLHGRMSTCRNQGVVKYRYFTTPWYERAGWSAVRACTTS